MHRPEPSLQTGAPSVRPHPRAESIEPLWDVCIYYANERRPAAADAAVAAVVGVFMTMRRARAASHAIGADMASKVARGKALKRSRPAASPAPVKRKNLKRQTTAELVADELRSRIIAGEIGEGEQ